MKQLTSFYFVVNTDTGTVIAHNLLYSETTKHKYPEVAYRQKPNAKHDGNAAMCVYCNHEYSNVLYGK